MMKIDNSAIEKHVAVLVSEIDIIQGRVSEKVFHPVATVIVINITNSVLKIIQTRQENK